MITTLVLLSWAFPALGAVVIGAWAWQSPSDTDRAERITSGVMLAAVSASALCLCAVAAMGLFGGPSDVSHELRWLTSGPVVVRLTVLTDALSLLLGLAFAAACWMVGVFAVHYMHREPGFHRFYLLLTVFTAAALIVVTSGDAVLTFAGWEVAGFCSYLLIAHFYERRTAAVNATTVFIANRVGDVSFLLALFLATTFWGRTDWLGLTAAETMAEPLKVGAVGLCFVGAAMAKSGQLPFSWWLPRAMEGPTPSSALFYGAVMSHFGVYLVLRLAPLWEVSPALRALLIVVGASTAGYGFLCGLAQTDVKSGLAFSSVGQLGLMFAECGVGLTGLATLHLLSHGVWRGYQFLTAPSILAQLHGDRTRPVPGWLSERVHLYSGALGRGWLEELATRALVIPTSRLAADLERVDATVIDRATGLPGPAVRALSSLAGWEERRIGPTRILDAENDEFATGRGLVGVATALAARASHWLEDLLVVRMLGEGAAVAAHWVAGSLQWVERQLERPAILIAGVTVSLVILMGWVAR